jgi:hypothetical protein
VFRAAQNFRRLLSLAPNKSHSGWYVKLLGDPLLVPCSVLLIKMVRIQIAGGVGEWLLSLRGIGKRYGIVLEMVRIDSFWKI